MTQAFTWEFFLRKVFALLVSVGVDGAVRVLYHGEAVVNFVDDPFFTVTAAVQSLLTTHVLKHADISKYLRNKLASTPAIQMKSFDYMAALKVFRQEIFVDVLLPILPVDLQEQWQQVQDIEQIPDAYVAKSTYIHDLFAKLRTGEIKVDTPTCEPQEAPADFYTFGQASEMETSPDRPVSVVSERQLMTLRSWFGEGYVFVFGALRFYYAELPRLDVFTIIGSRAMSLDLSKVPVVRAEEEFSEIARPYTSTQKETVSLPTIPKPTTRQETPQSSPPRPRQDNASGSGCTCNGVCKLVEEFNSPVVVSRPSLERTIPLGDKANRVLATLSHAGKKAVRARVRTGPICEVAADVKKAIRTNYGNTDEDTVTRAAAGVMIWMLGSQLRISGGDVVRV